MHDKKRDVLLDLQDIGITVSNRILLENIHLSIYEGEFVYLVGRTGSGKSSLLKAIYGDITFSKGSGHICGYDINKLSTKDRSNLRRKLGMIFQEFRLFESWTVKDNLDFVLKATGWKDKRQRVSRIGEILEYVGLEDKVQLQASLLSGGEQQRLAIGRALLNRPLLIIADEPTGNLDPLTSDEIMYLMTNINKEHKTAIFFATHDYRLIEKFPNRILRCEGHALLEVTV